MKKQTKEQRKDKVWKEYRKIVSPARKEYIKITDTAYKKYKKKLKEIDEE